MQAPNSVHSFTLSRAQKSARSRSLTEEVLHDIPESPTSARQAFDILTTVSERLRRRGDPRAVFPDIYAVVTRRVRDSIHGPARPLFEEPQFISRLAGRFCELYLAALRRSLEGRAEHIEAWAEADRATRSGEALPIQHAVLGLNAHINFDLALGLFANVLSHAAQERGADLDRDDEARMRRYRHDHDAVNQILREALPEVIGLLAERYRCPASRLLRAAGLLARPVHEAALVVLTLWRTRVWDDLEALLAAPDGRSRSRIEARMNLRAALLSKVFSLRSPIRATSFDRPRPSLC